MGMKYKIDVIAALKEAGYNTGKIRKEKIMGEAMLQKLRNGQMVSWATLEIICELLSCQPGDLIEHRKGEGADKTAEAPAFKIVQPALPRHRGILPFVPDREHPRRCGRIGKPLLSRSILRRISRQYLKTKRKASHNHHNCGRQ